MRYINPRFTLHYVNTDAGDFSHTKLRQRGILSPLPVFSTEISDVVCPF